MHERFYSMRLSCRPNETRLYMDVHMADYLIVVMKKLQHVLFQGQHDYHS